MNTEENITHLISYLKQFVTPERLDNLNRVLNNRTKYLSIVLEDIYQSQNASAVLRTAECYGLQEVYIIENENKYVTNPKVALGASKWLNINKYSGKEEHNTKRCIRDLKERGYRLIGASPHIKKNSILNMDVSQPLAIFFGSELSGLSEDAMHNMDDFIHIPMYGFTESFNISVSAALCVSHLVEKIRGSNIKWKLSEKDKLDIMLNWLRNTIKRAGQIEDYYHKKIEGLCLPE